MGTSPRRTARHRVTRVRRVLRAAARIDHRARIRFARRPRGRGDAVTRQAKPLDSTARAGDADAIARPSRILPVIIVSQFAGTSLWFAGNAVLADLPHQWGLTATALGNVTSAVQLGFIIGTLAFSFLTIADRYSPRRVFF